MPKTRPPYSPELRRQMVDLVRAGRDPEDLAREFTDRAVDPSLGRRGRSARRSLKLPRFRGVFDGFRGYCPVATTSIAAS